ncbi:uncharacterized protein F4822DRAFT_324915 [Hypoxylon trugodes]|uniref:uncharacterized protein n=1 Tax=Hypoxylon trugodes TaxID=326681 RepID=UPI002198A046|nr:uncharacterized protein F4822DRAFT_324915 [Hypoxylon trugodes]KAI1386716.1 hypothetical protein F4822DRAFT_324915 [Hypoxylon trugodes]
MFLVNLVICLLAQALARVIVNKCQHEQLSIPRPHSPRFNILQGCASLNKPWRIIPLALWSRNDRDRDLSFHYKIPGPMYPAVRPHIHNIGNIKVIEASSNTADNLLTPSTSEFRQLRRVRPRERLPTPKQDIQTLNFIRFPRFFRGG